MEKIISSVQAQLERKDNVTLIIVKRGNKTTVYEQTKDKKIYCNTDE